MSLSLWTLQETVYKALQDSPALQDFLGTPVRLYDHVPANALAPYAVLGDMVISPFDCKDFRGAEHTLSIHIVSRYRGSREVKQICEAVESTLRDADLSGEGYSLVFSQMEMISGSLLEDGLTRLGVCRFKVITQTA
jgi:hypothetical protein